MELEDTHDVLLTSGPDDFWREVSQIAAAQVCESVGFEGLKQSVLDALPDIVTRFVFDWGKIANHYANLAGRTQCNVFDVIGALKDLEAPDMHKNALELSHGFAGSDTAREMVEYVSSSEEILFAQSLPQSQVNKNWKLIPSFKQMDETPPKHVPNWLPAFPDPHTYIQTPMWNERSTDPRSDNIEQARQRRKAEKSLLSLQQRLSAFTSMGTSEKDLTNIESGPILRTTPSEPREKTTDLIPLPAEVSDKVVDRTSDFSVLKAFAPAIDAIKGSDFCGDGDDEMNINTDVRPTFHFKAKTHKKYWSKFLDLGIQKQGNGSIVFKVGQDGKKNAAD